MEPSLELLGYIQGTCVVRWRIVGECVSYISQQKPPNWEWELHRVHIWRKSRLSNTLWGVHLSHVGAGCLFNLLMTYEGDTETLKLICLGKQTQTRDPSLCWRSQTKITASSAKNINTTLTLCSPQWCLKIQTMNVTNKTGNCEHLLRTYFTFRRQHKHLFCWSGQSGS